MLRFFNNLWRRLTHLPRRQQALIGLFSLFLALGVGVFVWGIFTGKIRPFAATNPTISNYATVTYTDSNNVIQTVQSNTVITEIDNPPTDPSNLAGTAVSTSQINLTWTGSTDTDATGVAGYHIYRNGAQLSNTITGTSFSDTGLTAGTTYTYQVSAYDNATPANESNKIPTPAISITTPGASNPNLIEAENMTPSNYGTTAYSWASGGSVAKLSGTVGTPSTGTLTTNYSGTTGRYDIKVFYNDESDGANTFKLYVNNVLVDQWVANANTGITDPQLGNLVNRTKTGINVSNGHQIKLEVSNPGGTDNEWGRVDKIELSPSTVTDVTVNIIASLQGKTSSAINAVTLNIYPIGQTTAVFTKTDITTDSSGRATVTATGLTVGNAYDFKIQSSLFLATKKTNITLTNPITIDFGLQKGGDLDGNNQVNLFDYSRLVGIWRSKTGDVNFNANYDIKQDGQINIYDYSLMVSNWRQSGN